MGKKKRVRSRLEWGQALSVISKFGVGVAQSLLDGEILSGSHSDGDLWHQEINTFSEVKVAGKSAGAIIVKEQLDRHYEDRERSDRRTVIVSYKNCGTWRGKYCHLPLRVGTTQRRLESFLAHNLLAVYVVHIDVIRAIFYSDSSRIKSHKMIKGWKTYRKISSADLGKLINDPKNLVEIGLDPVSYQVRPEPSLARFKNYSIRVMVYRIEHLPIFEDVSFDVEQFEALSPT